VQEAFPERLALPVKMERMVHQVNVDRKVIEVTEAMRVLEDLPDHLGTPVHLGRRGRKSPDKQFQGPQACRALQESQGFRVLPEKGVLEANEVMRVSVDRGVTKVTEDQTVRLVMMELEASQGPLGLLASLVRKERVVRWESQDCKVQLALRDLLG